MKRGNRWLMITVDPILDEDRHVTGFVFILSDITSQRRAEERLLNSLKEKEVLIKEIHHRVKNNMQVISSMLNLQSGLVTGEIVREVLRESQSRIRTMALIHEKLYQSEDLSYIDIGDYVRTLTRGLQSMYCGDVERIKVAVDITDVSLGIDHAIPVGLIVNELVSNAMKHAFTGGRAGRVRVGLRTEGGGWYLLRVEDDGVGLPQGFDVRGAETMGMVLVNTLVDQIGGTMSVDIDCGTRFRIRFRGGPPG